MQADPPIEAMQVEFPGQHADLRRLGHGPILCLESHAGAGRRRVILKTGRIDERVEHQLVAGGRFGMLGEPLDQAEEGEAAPHIVAIPAGIKGEADRPAALIGTEKE